MVRNKSMREQTNEKKLELSVQERRWRWLGHVQRTTDDRIAEQVDTGRKKKTRSAMCHLATRKKCKGR